MNSRARSQCWILGVVGTLCFGAVSSAPVQPELGRRAVTLLSVDGFRFKDLNKNGILDPYEDWRLPATARVADLLGRMSLEEKAGTMVHGTARTPESALGFAGTAYDLAAMTRLFETAHVTSLITRLSVAPTQLAEQNNKLQELAESGRLGIPLSISTDPRNHFQHVAGASIVANGFSQWPEPLGLAAIGDEQLVERFADGVRREYRATGIHVALSPQADLGTEPRWPRITGTFGEDPRAARAFVSAYIRGMQHGARGLDSQSVVAVVKHWVGYGAEPQGYDAHNHYGRFLDLSHGHLADHILPFEGAFAANVGSVMPTYAIVRGVELDGRPLEAVGAGFNEQLLTGLLRGKYHFKGVVLSDWAITMDCPAACLSGDPAQQPPDIGMPWGVESLSKLERVAKSIAAGVDQLGGTEESHLIVEAVRTGKLSEGRINESVRRIVLQKFQQGLFENPYVDPVAASRVVGSREFLEGGLAAQRRALVLLQNERKLLPLRPSAKLFLSGLSPDVARSHGLTVVDNPADATVAVLRLTAPFEALHPGFFFGSRQHEGSLAFTDSNPDYQRLKTTSAVVPTVVVIFMDRPAILTNIQDKAAAIFAEFGSSDDAVLGVLMGETHPQGHLPFSLPASMEAVEQQASDVPGDIPNALYPIGFGLHY